MTTDLDDTDDTWPMLDGPLSADATRSGTTELIVAAAWAARSEIGSVRRGNEDRWGHHERERFVVADGMGGHDGGELAASIAVEVLLRPGTSSWHERVAEANLEVLARTTAAGFSNSGTTLVAVILGGRRATIVGVGDSRVYRLRDGRLHQLTDDHTVRGELLAAGIDADRHTTRRKARGLTSYLGIDPARLRIDVIDVPTAAGDRLLLCSDGIHQAIHHDQLTTALGSGAPEVAVDRLMILADDAGGRDNATAIVIDLDRQDRP